MNLVKKWFVCGLKICTVVSVVGLACVLFGKVAAIGGAMAAFVNISI